MGNALFHLIGAGDIRCIWWLSPLFSHDICLMSLLVRTLDSSIAEAISIATLVIILASSAPSARAGGWLDGGRRWRRLQG